MRVGVYVVWARSLDRSASCRLRLSCPSGTTGKSATDVPCRQRHSTRVSRHVQILFPCNEAFPLPQSTRRSFVSLAVRVPCLILHAPMYHIAPCCIASHYCCLRCLVLASRPSLSCLTFCDKSSSPTLTSKLPSGSSELPRSQSHSSTRRKAPALTFAFAIEVDG